MAYTTIKKPSDYFNTKLYSGTGSSNSITGVGFQPDFTWIKRRNSATNHHLHNAISGATKVLYSNSTGAESTDAQKLSSFDSDGFTVGTNGDANNSAGTFASWNWLGANGTSANTDGSISSTVSANTTSGFSIVSYTGNSTTGATVGHGLNSVPKFIVTKNRTSSTYGWYCYHASLGATKSLYLHTSDAEVTSSTRWNDTTPTSSVFTLGNNEGVNGSTDMIAYCFAEKQGYSKFGSYTGNGSTDGTFVYTGFKPAWVLLKNTTGDNWTLLDSTRDIDNPASARILTNLNFAEGSSNTIDFYSNGFKLLRTDGGENGSGINYIYMAFAEEPLVGDNPATAR